MKTDTCFGIIRLHKNILHKNAFTLAEVLITLGIIGIVAAMTLPAIIHQQNTKNWKLLCKKITA